MSDIRYRRFEARDRDSVLSLFEAAFGKPRDPAQWKWEFLGGPRPALIVVAESDGKIVGHYAILPRKIKVGGKTLESGLVVDVMTHPDFGKRGIFVNSGLEAFRQAKEAGLQILMGFPNEAAIRGHLKVGWSELGYVTVNARPLKADSLRKMAGDRLKLPGFVAALLDRGLNALNRISLGDGRGEMIVDWISPEDLGSLKDEIEAFVSKSLTPYSVSNPRNPDWYAWRLSDPLDRTYTTILRHRSSRAIHGLGVLKVKEKDGMRTGAVMDLLALDGDGEVQRQVLQQLLRKALSEGCEILIVLGSPAARRRSVMTRMFMFPTPRRLRFIVRSTGDDRLPEELHELSNWHIELIDHDTI